MRRLQFSLLTVIAVFGFASITHAADMPVKAPPPPPVAALYNWTGFYIGTNAGWHRSKDADPASVSFDNSFCCGLDAVFNEVLPVTLTATGFVGGLHSGYNWQLSNIGVEAANIILGWEADFDALTGSSSRSLEVFGTAECSPPRASPLPTARGIAGWPPCEHAPVLLSTVF
jgi:hypothetical protein